MDSGGAVNAGGREGGEGGGVLGHFKLERLLGAGSFGEVRLATDRHTGRKVALKAVSKTALTDLSEVERVSREFFILTDLDHPHVIKLYQVFQHDRTLYLAMEYAGGGTLDTLLEAQGGRVSEGEAHRLFCQLASAVRYCHRQHIVHRDLKTENILLGDGDVVKVADFGLSNSVATGSGARSPVGTPLYSAPEVLFPQMYPALLAEQQGGGGGPGGIGEDGDGDGGGGSGAGARGMVGGGGPPHSRRHSTGVILMRGPARQYSGTMADVWSMGVILYRMVTGCLPFPADSMKQLKGALFAKRWDGPTVPLPPGLTISPSLAALLRSMLQLDPFCRPTAEEVTACSWVEDGPWEWKQEDSGVEGAAHGSPLLSLNAMFAAELAERRTTASPAVAAGHPLECGGGVVGASELHTRAAAGPGPAGERMDGGEGFDDDGADGGGHGKQAVSGLSAVPTSSNHSRRSSGGPRLLQPGASGAGPLPPATNAKGSPRASGGGGGCMGGDNPRAHRRASIASAPGQAGDAAALNGVDSPTHRSTPTSSHTGDGEAGGGHMGDPPPHRPNPRSASQPPLHGGVGGGTARGRLGRGLVVGVGSEADGERVEGGGPTPSPRPPPSLRTHTFTGNTPEPASPAHGMAGRRRLGSGGVGGGVLATGADAATRARRSSVAGVLTSDEGDDEMDDGSESRVARRGGGTPSSSSDHGHPPRSTSVPPATGADATTPTANASGISTLSFGKPGASHRRRSSVTGDRGILVRMASLPASAPLPTIPMPGPPPLAIVASSHGVSEPTPLSPPTLSGQGPTLMPVPMPVPSVMAVDMGGHPSPFPAAAALGRTRTLLGSTEGGMTTPGGIAGGGGRVHALPATLLPSAPLRQPTPILNTAPLPSTSMLMGGGRAPLLPTKSLVCGQVGSRDGCTPPPPVTPTGHPATPTSPTDACHDAHAPKPPLSHSDSAVTAHGGMILQPPTPPPADSSGGGAPNASDKPAIPVAPPRTASPLTHHRTLTAPLSALGSQVAPSLSTLSAGSVSTGVGGFVPVRALPGGRLATALLPTSAPAFHPAHDLHGAGVVSTGRAAMVVGHSPTSAPTTTGSHKSWDSAFVPSSPHHAITGVDSAGAGIMARRDVVTGSTGSSPFHRPGNTAVTTTTFASYSLAAGTPHSGPPILAASIMDGGDGGGGPSAGATGHTPAIHAHEGAPMGAGGGSSGVIVAGGIASMLAAVRLEVGGGVEGGASARSGGGDSSSSRSRPSSTRGVHHHGTLPAFAPLTVVGGPTTPGLAFNHTVRVAGASTSVATAATSKGGPGP